MHCNGWADLFILFSHFKLLFCKAHLCIHFHLIDGKSDRGKKMPSKVTFKSAVHLA